MLCSLDKIMRIIYNIDDSFDKKLQKSNYSERDVAYEKFNTDD